MKPSSIFLLASMGLIVFLSACAPSGGKMTVTDVWARPMPQGQTSAIYFKLQNQTDADDQLIAVSSDIAANIEMHLSEMNDKSVMSMSKQETVLVPAGGSVAFEPGGLHVMLIDLQQDLVLGESFPVVLRFEQAGDIPLQVEVKPSP